jgi:uncharacterized membrane protein
MDYALLLSLASFGLSLFLFFRMTDLQETIRQLREEKQTKPISDQSQAIKMPAAVQQPTATPFPQQLSPNTLERLLAWYKHEWPLKTGALFILLGFVWLVTYAFLNNWIGPIGRITFGIIIGSLTLVFGELRLRKIVSQGITLVGLGAAIVTVTVYAAQEIYTMFPPFVALLFIVAVMVLTTIISLRHMVLSLSIVSLLIGGIAPLLVGSGGQGILMLYGYLLAVVIGVIWIARFSKWNVLTLIALGIVSFYSATYFFDSAKSLQEALLPHEFLGLRFFAITFTSLFFFTTLGSIITNKKASQYDLLAAGAIGFVTFGWINGLVLSEYKSMITLFAALFFSAASYLVFLRTQIRHAVYIYTAIAVVLLGIATGFAFDGPILTIAFSLEAALLFIVASLFFDEEIAKRMLFYYIVPLFLSIPVMLSPAWNSGIIHADFAALSIIMLSFLGTGVYIYSLHMTKEKPLHQAAVFLIVVGAIYCLLLVWKVSHSLFSPDYLARLLALSLYSLAGLGAYVYGEIHKRDIVHKFGLAVLLFVVGRLLVVEVWDMELTVRIVTFFVIGVLFIGSVLIRKTAQK